MSQRTRQIGIPCGRNFTIMVSLPVTPVHRHWANLKLDEIRIATTAMDQDTFMKRLDYLPVTDQELAEADRMHSEGMDWHTACAKAKGHVSCHCPDCEPLPR